MKLSEKLAALEQEETERDAAQAANAPAAPAAGVAKRARPVKPKGTSSWDATKKKVRELVLDEVAPKMGGLTAEELAAEVKAALDRKEKFVFIDCRLPNEYQITKIDGAELIPLQQLAQAVVEDRRSERALDGEQDLGLNPRRVGIRSELQLRRSRLEPRA